MTVPVAWPRLRGRLVGYFRARVPDATTAEDLTQDVLARVHQNLSSVRDERRLHGWISRIARNRLTDYYRARGRPEPEPLEPGVADDDDPSPELNQLVGAWLMAMVEGLPDTYRLAVRMAEVEGKTQREVADELGLSLSGAKSRVQRGRALLRRDLQRCCSVRFDSRGNVIDVAPRDTSCC